MDGSWSVGRENFKHIRSFIASLAGAFDIGEEKTRVAVVQYSTDTRTEFPLTRYSRRGDLLQAINNLPYKGGNTMTGKVLYRNIQVSINRFVLCSMIFVAVVDLNCRANLNITVKKNKNARTFVSQGDAIDYLLQNIFTEAAGSRKGFPKVAMIITDGKSQDPVEEYAKRLRNIGVEIFVLGMVYYCVLLIWPIPSNSQPVLGTHFTFH